MRALVEFSADVGGAIGAQDVEGEAAEPCEVAGFGSNAAVVFEEADITDVMAAVFDAPMLADRRGGCAGGQPDLTGEEGCLVGEVPAAGGGVLVPGEPGDAGGDDQAKSTEQPCVSNDVGIFGGAFLPAGLSQRVLGTRSMIASDSPRLSATPPHEMRKVELSIEAYPVVPK